MAVTSPNDTAPGLPPVVELDACELVALAGGLVTEADYLAAGRTRPLPAPTDAVFVPGVE